MVGRSLNLCGLVYETERMLTACGTNMVHAYATAVHAYNIIIDDIVRTYYIIYDIIHTTGSYSMQY